VSGPAAPLAAIRVEADGVRLRLRLTPRASRETVGPLERLADGSEVLIVHVRAVPADGAANAALIRLLAASLDVARSKVDLVAGQTARIKTVVIEGDGPALAERLATLAAAAK
jgi:uncharacterized protein YggU (UPF0235/DUF167 family)